MASSDDFVEILRAAAGDRAEARRVREHATDRLAEAAYRARQQGVPIREIVAASGLTKQGLYDVARARGFDLAGLNKESIDADRPLKTRRR